MSRLHIRHLPARALAVTSFVALMLMLASSPAAAQYQLTNLSSNQVKAAKHTDPLLVNAWGLVHAPGNAWWVSDNNSGWSTLYNAAGVAQGPRAQARRQGLCGVHRRPANSRWRDGRHFSCLPRWMEPSAAGHLNRMSTRRLWQWTHRPVRLHRSVRAWPSRTTRQGTSCTLLTTRIIKWTYTTEISTWLPRSLTLRCPRALQHSASKT